MGKELHMSQTNETVYDVLIAGAGIPGAILALGVARLGYRVALIDPGEGLVKSGDTRTTAFLPESLDFLDRFALLDPVRGQAQPLMHMRLMNDQGELRDRPAALTFDGAAGAPLALNIPNAILAQSLAEAIATLGGRLDCLWNTRILKAEEAGGRARLGLDSGQSLSAPMAIAADGRTSTIRTLLNISWRGASTHQTALTARLRHMRPHEGVSTEFHRHTGPMTFVPVREACPGSRQGDEPTGGQGDGHETALVWCLSNAVADQMWALDDEAFLGRVQMASRGILGRIDSLHARGRFPVRPGMAAALHRGSFALMAEAAHVLPPLLAQGLNLSLKDCEIMLRQVQHHGPGAQAAQAYAAARWPDVAARLAVSEGLNQFLHQAPPPLSAVYRLGHRGLQSLPFARQLVVRLGQRGQQSLP